MTISAKRITGAAAAAFGAGLGFLAGVPAAQAAAPLEDSDLYQMLKPHEAFMKKLSNCCNMDDGRPVELIETGDPEQPYKFILTVSTDGLRLEKPLEVYVPKSKILGKDVIDQAIEACAPEIEKAEAAGQISDCGTLPFDATFLTDNFNRQPDGTFNVYISGSPMRKVGADYVIPLEEYKPNFRCLYIASPL